MGHGAETGLFPGQGCEFSDFDDEYQSVVSTMSLGEVREKFASDLALLVRGKKVEEIFTWPALCWEIDNRRLIQDWVRASELFEQAGKLKLKQPWEINLLRGQFDFLVGFKQTGAMTFLGTCKPWMTFTDRTSLAFTPKASRTGIAPCVPRDQTELTEMSLWGGKFALGGRPARL